MQNPIDKLMDDTIAILSECESILRRLNDPANTYEAVKVVIGPQVERIKTLLGTMEKDIN
ncbi:MAG: hypothetical protein US52_C0004G0007 [candidate division WS6 bacterium GW2011_GWA2_37_6]|uniref:Uncharacterized protein n=1 Tax=candidate division WS6 bacterium GW2011_GWA2_37_6 TaxID=1619087 RepID=A0A0G0K6I7_9BACT|nr:MAG: hypothetical protein US52_C0004G0007 [candidate division WS6 bacterium GW2011_GWA2_37_6]